MTAQEAKIHFLKHAQDRNTRALYAGTWENCTSDIMECWAQAAQRRAAVQYGIVDTALAQRIYLET